MARRAFYFASIVALILATASAVPCFAISKEFNQTYPLTAGRNLRAAKREWHGGRADVGSR